MVDFWLHPGETLTLLSIIPWISHRALSARYGTTSFLATVVLPRDHPNTHATLGVLNERSGKTGHGAVLEGIHAEVLNILTTLGQMEVFRDLYFLGWEKVSREVSSVHT